MSRGLGKRQRDLLAVLSMLDTNHPEHHFSMASIVSKLYAASPDLQEREQRAKDYVSDLEARAKAGDQAAIDLLHIRSEVAWLMRRRDARGRPRHRDMPNSVEHHVNPSRCMGALLRRGLVHRGLHGWYKLTPTGREMVAT